MSTYWGLRCETCNVNSDCWLNHGDGLLRCVMENWGAIEALRLTGYLSVEIDAPYGSEIFQFIRDHLGHHLLLRNEYGTTKAMKEHAGAGQVP